MPPSNISWIVIVGPTAVGKSRVAEVLALKLRTEILVADSRQIYQGMDIGTNKPTLVDRLKVQRHLIDVIPPDQSFSAGSYKEMAGEKIACFEQQGRPILIEGGTGLYIKAVLYGLWEGPKADWSLRQRLYDQEKEEGEGALYAVLTDVDPLSAKKIHPKDLPKIIRALEVHSLAGRPLSDFHAQHRFTEGKRPAALMIGLGRDKKDLYERIDIRVEQQMEDGLIHETESFLSKGLSPSLPSMRGIGYRQMVSYLKGEKTLPDAIASLKMDTRHYAKRQMTWFRADPHIQWLHITAEESEEETADRICHFKELQNCGIIFPS